MDEKRVAAFVGFAAKSRRVIKGEAMLKAIREGRAEVALVDACASENTKKRYRNACIAHDIPFFESPEECVGLAAGAGNCMALAVTDEKLARAIIESMDTDGG